MLLFLSRPTRREEASTHGSPISSSHFQNHLACSQFRLSTNALFLPFRHQTKKAPRSGCSFCISAMPFDSALSYHVFFTTPNITAMLRLRTRLRTPAPQGTKHFISATTVAVYSLLSQGFCFSASSGVQVPSASGERTTRTHMFFWQEHIELYRLPGCCHVSSTWQWRNRSYTWAGWPTWEHFSLRQASRFLSRIPIFHWSQSSTSPPCYISFHCRHEDPTTTPSSNSFASCSCTACAVPS